MLYIINRRLISKVRKRTISRADITDYSVDLCTRTVEYHTISFPLVSRVHRRSPEGDEQRD